MPRELIEEEVREQFLRHVNHMVEYWCNESRVPDVKEKLEGLAFSIMVAIDGGSSTLPAFILAPFPASEDKAFHIENGENYYPDNNLSKVNCDIAGSLHELLKAYRK